MSATPHPTAHPTDLLARRDQLRLRSALLREQIAQRAQTLRPALRLADRARAGAGWARRHPAWLAAAGGAALGVLATRPKRALALALRAWSAWRVLRRFKPALAFLLERR